MKSSSDKKLRIVLLGTSEFAIKPFRRIIESAHEIVAVVTKTDRHSGRGRKKVRTPVMDFITGDFPDIDVIQPDSLKDQDFQNKLSALQADLFVVASFPIMPMTVVNIPPFGCLNIHPSLLPKYRGAAPIRWTLMKGDAVTGVTTFFIGGKVDAGSIFLQRELQVLPMEDYQSLHDRLSEFGADLVLESLKKIIMGDISTIPQDESLATPAPKIQKSHCAIDWSKPAQDICNQIRALSPEPGAYTIFRGKRLKLYSSQIADTARLNSGEGHINQQKLFIGCKDLCLELLEVQLEGRKRMKAQDFIRGLHIDSNWIELN